MSSTTAAGSAARSILVDSSLRLSRPCASRTARKIASLLSKFAIVRLIIQLQRQGRKHDCQQPGRVGADLQYLLGRGLSLHPFVSADAPARRGGPHRQHEQRQRVLGSIGPDIPQTAYAAAKFAVKGFSEALITDLLLNAPHIKCSVVMPGHIGTSIPLNSRNGVGSHDL